MAKKTELEKEKKDLEEWTVKKEVMLMKLMKTVGNYVHDSVPVSDDEVGYAR